jgi:hypothetical protein
MVRTFPFYSVCSGKKERDNTARLAVLAFVSSADLARSQDWLADGTVATAKEKRLHPRGRQSIDVNKEREEGFDISPCLKEREFPTLRPVG